MITTPAFPGPAYRIHTRRLVIRCWEPTDTSALKTALDESTEHLLTFMPWAANEPEPLQTKLDRIRSWRGKFDLGQDFVYGIFLQDESRVAGGTGLHTRVGPGALEIGYWIHKDLTHQGFATEISAALTKVAFEINGVSRVEIHCAVENEYSAAVPRRLGYTLEATLRKRTQLVDGHFHDQMVWTLLRDEYPGSPAAKAEIEAYDAMRRRIL